MVAAVNRKILKSRCSAEASKTPDSVPVRVTGSLMSSGWENVTRGGDRAARRCLSWQGVTGMGLLAATAARFSKKILKLRPSSVVWLVEIPSAKPPQLNDVTWIKHHNQSLN